MEHNDLDQFTEQTFTGSIPDILLSLLNMIKRKVSSRAFAEQRVRHV